MNTNRPIEIKSRQRIFYKKKSRVRRILFIFVMAAIVPFSVHAFSKPLNNIDENAQAFPVTVTTFEKCTDLKVMPPEESNTAALRAKKLDRLASLSLGYYAGVRNMSGMAVQRSPEAYQVYRYRECVQNEILRQQAV